MVQQRTDGSCVVNPVQAGEGQGRAGHPTAGEDTRAEAGTLCVDKAVTKGAGTGVLLKSKRKALTPRIGERQLKPGRHARFSVSLKPMKLPFFWGMLVLGFGTIPGLLPKTFEASSPSSGHSALVWAITTLGMFVALTPALAYGLRSCIGPTSLPDPINKLVDAVILAKLKGQLNEVGWTARHGVLLCILHACAITWYVLLPHALVNRIPGGVDDDFVYRVPTEWKNFCASTIHMGLIPFGLVLLTTLQYSKKSCSCYENARKQLEQVHPSFTSHADVLVGMATRNVQKALQPPLMLFRGLTCVLWAVMAGLLIKMLQDEVDSGDRWSDSALTGSIQDKYSRGDIIVALTFVTAVSVNIYWAMRTIFTVAMVRYKKAGEVMRFFRYLLDPDRAAIPDTPSASLAGGADTTAPPAPPRAHPAIVPSALLLDSTTASGSTNAPGSMDRIVAAVSPTYSLTKVSLWYELLWHFEAYEIPWMIGRAEVMLIASIIAMALLPFITLMNIVHPNSVHATPLEFLLLVWTDSGPYWLFTLGVLIIGGALCIYSAGMLGWEHSRMPTLLDLVAVRLCSTTMKRSGLRVAESTATSGDVEAGMVAAGSAGSMDPSPQGKFAFELVKRRLADNPFNVWLAGMVSVDPVKIRLMMGYLASGLVSAIVTSI